MKKINQNHYFSKSDIHGVDIESHLQEINSEFKAGFEFVKKFPKSVSIFGSSRAKPGTSNYQLAEKLAERIVSELNYAVVTGGGP
jgi:predicted Rossmann-fold nucleotide-binding protein